MKWSSISFLAMPVCAFDYEVTVPGLGVLQGTATNPARSDGTLPGTKQYPDVAQFMGIPYAKPPIGNLRFQPPQPHGAWESPRDATSFGSACWQGGGNPQPVHGKSEDCLFLDVTTPSKQLTSDEKLPVMFYIYGGAYVNGEEADYPLDALVSQNNYSIVAVVPNYRIGPFGFLGGLDIQAQTSDGSTGNFGIQDQRAAMMWVKQNIAAFGGDGDEITIFGESAGGNAVMNHLAQPASFPYYKKAIIESGTYNRGATALATSESDYQSVLKLSGCSDLDCLLALPAETLNKLDLLFLNFGPVIDGVSLTASPWDLVIEGKHNKDVPVMIGSNRDEAALVTNHLPKQLGENTFNFFMTALLGIRDAYKVKKLYDPSVYDYPSNLGGFSQWWWTLTEAATDTVPGLGACGTRTLARNLFAGGSEHVYTYFFSKPSLTGPIIPSQYIVGHATEILFAYGDVHSMEVESEKELALAMSAYWSSFAIHGDPNHDGLPTWPLYDSDTDTLMRFDDSPRLGGVHTQQALRKDACDFWADRAIPGDVWDRLLREALQHSQQPDVVVV